MEAIMGAACARLAVSWVPFMVERYDNETALPSLIRATRKTDN
jgi:hypothetical protein